MKKIAALTLILVTIAAVTVLANAYPIIIDLIETKDLQGNLKTTFRRGEVIVIETRLKANPSYYFVAPVDYLEIVEVFYGPYVMNLLLTRDSISSGETKEFGGGYRIRDSDPTGTYVIEVYVWNGFPSEVGAAWKPLADMKTKSFTVTP